MSELFIGHNQVAEQAVLGAMLFEKSAIEAVAELVTTDDFFQEIHRHIFAAVMELYSADIGVDTMTLTQKLKDRGHLDQIGGDAYLYCLMEAAPTAAGAKYYAEILRQESLKRSIVRLAQESLRLTAETETSQVESLLETLKTQWDALGGRTVSTDTLRSVGEIAAEGWEDLAARKQNAVQNGLPSGISALDKITGGFLNDTLVVLGAWQNEGKSTLLLNWLCHLSCYLSVKVPTLLFSLEMDHQSLVGKILAAQAQVEHYRLRNPQFMGDAEFGRVTDTCSKLYKTPLYIDDASGLTMDQIAIRAKRAVRKYKIRCVAIDFFQHIAVPKGTETQRHGYVAAAIRAKELAKELHLPVIMASQLGRKEKQAPNRRPRKSDLAETSALETYADQVILLHHPDGTTNDGMKTIIVDKNRLGPKGDAAIYWHGDYQTFRDIEHHELVSETSKQSALEQERREKRNGRFSSVFTG